MNERPLVFPSCCNKKVGLKNQSSTLLDPEKKFTLNTFDLNCFERPALNPSSEAFVQGIRKALSSLKAFLINLSGFLSKRYIKSSVLFSKSLIFSFLYHAPSKE